MNTSSKADSSTVNTDYSQVTPYNVVLAQPAATDAVVKYNSTGDGWLNMTIPDQDDPEKYIAIPSSHRLWHSSKQARGWINVLSSDDEFGKPQLGVIFINDFSDPNKIKGFQLTEGMSYMTLDGVEYKYDADSLEKVNQEIALNLEEYLQMKKEPTEKQLKAILQYGEVIGYGNLYLVQIHEGKVILQATPGSMPLRAKMPRDVKTLAMLSPLKEKGLVVHANFRWVDPELNQKVNSSGNGLVVTNA